ncbi:MAG: hypothetical protein JSU00_15500 [Acidobacteria bacterium]|nr:hypothetical protein [Acidobacteriota bacterium]
MKRREFLATPAGGFAMAATPPSPAIDFRYAPLSYQTAYCYPDDPHKSLVGEHGELRIGHPGSGKPLEYFTSIVEFSASGMETDRVVSQKLESPRTPIVRTVLERSALRIELTTFATNRAGEGRVDNVIAEFRPKGDALRVAPLVRISTRDELATAPPVDGRTEVRKKDGTLFLLSDAPLRIHDSGHGAVLFAPVHAASTERPARLFFRFPQEGQSAERLSRGLGEPDAMLASAREWWTAWRPYGGKVNWSLAGRYQEFLDACARNIQQAREVKNGRKTFQVGPTVYRGLWIVDGNFLLEAARYLGYDEEARQGLEATWAHQRDDGGVFAAVQGPFWKDTGIAMFTMVRQAELSQDWTYFRTMAPNILKAARFLEQARDRSIREGGTNGRYRILPAGLGDGGLAGAKHEFTNTVWALAGLRAVSDAARRLELPGFVSVSKLHDELHEDCLKAARQEMRRHPRGFEFLPMLTRDDPGWSEPDEWNRPRLQVAQWALSHAIYPGLVFAKDDPVVRGHVSLMRACTEEDVPIETGWLPHEGLWTYNAPFVSHVYLWAGRADWASQTFTGFLNHASPLYCWREEMPLRQSAVSNYVGDMPHNWASAECVLYLRHMFALEDGRSLRLLAGLTTTELEQGDRWQLEQTPTRFGRLDLKLTRQGGAWRLEFARDSGDAPGEVVLPRRLAGRFTAGELKGAAHRISGDRVLVEPGARSWSCVWS